MSETPSTPVRLSEDERDLAAQIAAQVSGKEEIAAGLRIALHAEAKRRKLKPRPAEKKGAVKG